MEILYQDRHFVFVSKLPGIDVHGRTADDPDSLVGRVARLLGVPAWKLHPASRLDRPVSGVVPLARSKIGRRSLTQQYQAHRVAKRYLALTAATPSPLTGAWERPIGVDPREPRRRTLDGRDPRDALTEYEVVRALSAGTALVALEPRTGRTHQLRVHLSALAGCPILGDRRYGGPRAVTLDDGTILAAPRVMLHAERLSLHHPESGALLEVTAPLPDDFRSLLSALSSPT